MQIHLKRGEKIYVNGAVLRIDRRASLEFLNNVNFLLENHVIQAEEANTPIRQLYFVVQTMLIDPENSGVTLQLYRHLHHRLIQATQTPVLVDPLKAIEASVEAGRYFDALKQLRGLFGPEAELLHGNRQEATAITEEEEHAGITGVAHPTRLGR